MFSGVWRNVNRVSKRRLGPWRLEPRKQNDGTKRRARARHDESKNGGESKKGDRLIVEPAAKAKKGDNDKVRRGSETKSAA